MSMLFEYMAGGEWGGGLEVLKCFVRGGGGQNFSSCFVCVCVCVCVSGGGGGVRFNTSPSVKKK